ncbi:MAG: DNA polymerase III subunit gamma/tau [Saprospiraceae bacterium]|nr:DNA polymerase III subunit gamma/tau [Saprospiraceae bacterium]
MSTFVVSARKYRPNRFDEVVGQEHVSLTLKNALQNDHLAHAFLFCGPRGVGKTTCARILAKVLNCQNPTSDFEPCNTCDSCDAFNENASFNITELDAASNNSVEHIRALIEQVRFQPQKGKYKVFIIDEVHMLSQQAFNAFLKTLEEPPPYAIFILATTEKHKIIPTILSRCQIFDFRRIQVPNMVKHLTEICAQEGIEAESDALHIVAQKADGALRDALSIFDRIVSFSGKQINYDDVITNLNVLDYDYYFKFVDALLREDVSQVLLIFDDILRKGFDAELFVNGLAEHLRNLLVCKDEQTLSLLEVSDGLRQRYKEQAAVSPNSYLLTALNLANDCDINYKMARNKRLHAEMALIKMAHINRAFRLAQHAPAEASPEKKTVDNSQPIVPPPSQVEHSQPEPDSAAPKEAPTAATKEPVPEPKEAEPITQQVNSVSNGHSPGNIQPASKIATKHSIAKVSLDSLIAEAQEDVVKEEEVEQTELTIEHIQTAWTAFIEQLDKDTIKGIFRNAKIDLQEKTLVIKVGSGLAESAIREELSLMDFIRKQVGRSDLIMKIHKDDSLVQKAAPKPKKMLNAKEKFLLMNETNPKVRELIDRFGLRPDDER